MFKTLIKHKLFEYCIDVMFNGLYVAFSTRKSKITVSRSTKVSQDFNIYYEANVDGNIISTPYTVELFHDLQVMGHGTEALKLIVSSYLTSHQIYINARDIEFIDSFFSDGYEQFE